MFARLLLPSLIVLSASAYAADNPPVEVTITKTGCEPMTLDVPAGKTTFKIKNASQRALEWEILKGVMVVDERENILPGFTQQLTSTLDPGDYAMTCGLLSNPQGALKVTAAGGAAKAGPVSAMDLVGPIAEYKVYVMGEVNALVANTKTLVDAVKAGKLDAAQAAYAPAHLRYERIEPIAELFSDLDGSMDSRADDFEGKEKDPKFLGFHRLEKGIFADRSTDGLVPVADKLMTDVLDLQKRLDTLSITPKAMVGGAADLIEEVASKKITGEEDRYSRTDLWDFQANIDGARKIVDLLRPLIDARNPALDGRVKDNFAKVDALLAKYKAGEGFEPYDKLADKDRDALKGPITTLAEDLSTFRGTLGID